MILQEFVSRMATDSSIARVPADYSLLTGTFNCPGLLQQVVADSHAMEKHGWIYVLAGLYH
jgi:pyrrolidone-carboxylate peptidase